MYLPREFPIHLNISSNYKCSGRPCNLTHMGPTPRCSCSRSNRGLHHLRRTIANSICQCLDKTQEMNSGLWNRNVNHTQETVTTNDGSVSIYPHISSTHYFSHATKYALPQTQPTKTWSEVSRTSPIWILKPKVRDNLLLPDFTPLKRLARCPDRLGGVLFCWGWDGLTSPSKLGFPYKCWWGGDESTKHPEVGGSGMGEGGKGTTGSCGGAGWVYEAIGGGM